MKSISFHRGICMDTRSKRFFYLRILSKDYTLTQWDSQYYLGDYFNRWFSMLASYISLQATDGLNS
jgi:hypothetical protein